MICSDNHLASRLIDDIGRQHFADQIFISDFQLTEVRFCKLAHVTRGNPLAGFHDDLALTINKVKAQGFTTQAL